jgi:hypothetical protein
VGAEPAERPVVAVVAVDPAALGGAELAERRAQLAQRYRLLDAAEVCRVLEREEPPTRPEDGVREALTAARLALRRFDMTSVSKALAAARERARGLGPDSGRLLALELALDSAEAAVVDEQPSAALREMAVALSIDPALLLEAARFPPPVTGALAKARDLRAKARPVEVEIHTSPPGAQVVLGGKAVGSTPAHLTVAPGPSRLWLVREGMSPLSLEVDLQAGAVVEAPLVPVPLPLRAYPVVQALRSASGAERSQLGEALALALGVDGVALVASAHAEPTLIMRAAPTEGPPAPAMAVQTQAARPRHLLLPALVLAAGVAMTVAAVGLGLVSRHDAISATHAEFASDGAALTAAAQTEANSANALFALAAASGVAAVVLYLVF